jgi:hypothetical protein
MIKEKVENYFLEKPKQYIEAIEVIKELSENYDSPIENDKVIEAIKELHFSGRLEKNGFSYRINQ